MSEPLLEKKRWYALYTRPRWEKKVHALLTGKGIHSYCPLNKVEKQWSDRRKIVEEPLFKSYVFVHVTEEERMRVRMTQGVVNFVYWLGKPAVVSAKDIDTIQRFLDVHSHVSVEAYSLLPDDQVLVCSGIFTDQTATVLQVNKKKVEVRIDSLHFKLVAWVDRKRVQPLKKMQQQINH